MKPKRKCKPGDRVIFGKNFNCTIEHLDTSCTVSFQNSKNLKSMLQRYGSVPLPPYIRRGATAKDVRRYQTVYAERYGSVAAPTAGLHFTKSLLNSLRRRGVTICSINLEVGLGTFAPIRAANVEEHVMHSERYEIPKQTATIINSAKREGRRVIAVGTTVVRALESSVDDHCNVKSEKRETNIFIYPPYKFKIIDALITNFHLPQSSLLLLICAFGGKKRILRAYHEAIKEKYRFFSYGDAMLII